MKHLSSGLRNLVVGLMFGGLIVGLVFVFQAQQDQSGSGLSQPATSQTLESPLATPNSKFNSPLATPTPGGPMPKIYAISNDGEWLDFEAMAQSLLLLQGSHTGNRQMLPTPPAR